MDYVQSVILCGGVGTRLWPLSTKAVPKQFVDIGDGSCLLEATLLRLELLNCKEPILVMNKDHEFAYSGTIIKEKYANDTAAAVANAIQGLSSETIIVAVPSDHYIGNSNAFISDLKKGISLVTSDNIVLFGLQATTPETKYGYIVPGTPISFQEKPKAHIAQQLISKGALWNSGIFASTVGYVDKMLKEANIYDWLDFPREGKAPSFDVAILQKCDNLTLVECKNWNWSDVGTWDSFLQIPEIQKEMQGNCIQDVCANVEVLNRGEGKVMCIGCENLRVIVVGNDVLVINKNVNYDNNLKNLASNL